ncbi:hypothetical protein EV128_113107 [Rhizobium azibense]|nr:hypothetical protein EV128_113107 [Rhizobium azibense]
MSLMNAGRSNNRARRFALLPSGEKMLEGRMRARPGRSFKGRTKGGAQSPEVSCSCNFPRASIIGIASA